MGLDCVRKELAAAGGTAASDLQPTAAGASESLDWGAAGIGAGIGVAGGLCVGAAVVLAAQRRGRLAHV